MLSKICMAGLACLVFSQNTQAQSAKRQVYDNRYNPSIGVIIDGRYNNYSQRESEFAGFAIGEEGERSPQGFALDESELNFAGNVDDKFSGSLTAALVTEGGEDIVELEEAYLLTLPGARMPGGMVVKAGRAFWTLGYLNELHSHTDDFADRPLPYRVFLNDVFNDDGLQASFVLPTVLYVELGAGLFRGDDFPFGGTDGEGIPGWSAFARTGGDVGEKNTWRVGLSVLSGEAKDGRGGNEDSIIFRGDTDLFIADVRYIFAPTGNARLRELILQGEFFWRNEDGTYQVEDSPPEKVDDDSYGLYLQGVYKFRRTWRVGLRYSRLDPASVGGGLSGSALDADGHDPQSYSAMVDWTNSEFSRLRLQYNYEDLASGQNDNQVILQFIIGFGAHSAHKF